jgi:endonuclease/exonuclease/phosphatase (EEP) superfamily protein YafD
MRLLGGALFLAVAVAWLASLLGLLAPVWPIAELGNHFRPYILLGCLVLAMLALPVRLGIAMWSGLAATLFNGAILASAVALAPVAHPSAATGKHLTLVSFNMWVKNTHFTDVVEYLRRANADIVFLQEMDEDNAANLVPALVDIYPHVLSCAAVPYCGLVFLSKHPWERATYAPAGEGKPRLVRVRFGEALGGVEIVGTHFAMPFKADVQARNAAWFTDYAAGIPAPAIIFGDFNLTPWSWQLVRFSMVTGLKRIGTFRNSWPAPGTVKGFPFSVFLIDNAFVTDGISLQDWSPGPRLGSDHRPIIARFMVEALE